MKVAWVFIVSLAWSNALLEVEDEGEDAGSLDEIVPARGSSDKQKEDAQFKFYGKETKLHKRKRAMHRRAAVHRLDSVMDHFKSATGIKIRETEDSAIRVLREKGFKRADKIRGAYGRKRSSTLEENLENVGSRYAARRKGMRALFKAQQRKAHEGLKDVEGRQKQRSKIRTGLVNTIDNTRKYGELNPYMKAYQMNYLRNGAEAARDDLRQQHAGPPPSEEAAQDVPADDASQAAADLHEVAPVAPVAARPADPHLANVQLRKAQLQADEQSQWKPEGGPVLRSTETDAKTWDITPSA